MALAPARVIADHPVVTTPTHVLTIVAVEDLARAKKFYTDAFGWPLHVDTTVYAEFALPAGMRLGVYERIGFARNTGQVPVKTPAGAISATEIYFYVDELSSAIERLKNAGARELSPLAPRSWGDAAAYFADPDGNVLVLARPLEVG